MESGYNGEQWGRYSFIGLSSRSRLIIRNHEATYIKNNEICEQIQTQQPLQWLEGIMATFKVPPLPLEPRFMGGFVGYFGYETVHYIEPKLGAIKQTGSLDVPDILLILAEEIVVYDNLTNKAHLIIYSDPSDPNSYDKATSRIEQLQQQLILPIKTEDKPSKTTSDTFHSNFNQADYERQVTKAKGYTKNGDAMQMILSQRFSKTFYHSPLAVYRTLRQLNPSPYMYYFNLDDFYIVGASPEILVRLENDEVTVKPLAGTRPRGKTQAEDKALELELLADPKELAEHLMLIDLGRNDIGRICETGTVEVREKMVIERYSHVMHISSTVVGKVKPNIKPLAILRATFPAGTVSGAPKIRAMEIINELEDEKRGIYGGAVGYLGWNHNMDLAIALRTAVIKDNKIYVQAGAGLVADSDPTQEWQECINKASALFLATKRVEQNS
jgi:anthranilate synthase component 1